jgi:hypothetical protein
VGTRNAMSTVFVCNTVSVRKSRVAIVAAAVVAAVSLFFVIPLLLGPAEVYAEITNDTQQTVTVAGCPDSPTSLRPGKSIRGFFDTGRTLGSCYVEKANPNDQNSWIGCLLVKVPPIGNNDRTFFVSDARQDIDGPTCTRWVAPD